MSSLFEKHRGTLEKAVDACEKRYAWTAYPESPSSKIHGKEIPAAGLAAYESMPGRPFDIELPGAVGEVGEEVSPLTGEALGIT
ncbi:MAG TPA: phenylacetic acid degradation protein PaaN, partial [Woeseiaceae bacterium]|nr:phenylacetic acid degradation protein PaaN [Woeseiaceae bacterium]